MTTALRDAARVEMLHASSIPIDDVEDLVRLLPQGESLAWVRSGEGLVGWGEAARFEVGGHERFSRANRWWARMCADAVVDDSVMCPGSGPVAFASFAFDHAPGASVVIIPRVVVGRRDGKAWLTIMSGDGVPVDASEFSDSVKETDQPASPGLVVWRTDEDAVSTWRSSVGQAVERITAGKLDKVVLAREVSASTERPIDVRHLLHRLSEKYPDCWAFSVDGLVGATPELLVRRESEKVTSRVLAGTVRTGLGSSENGRLAAELLGSHKDQEEHQYAVRSVATSLSAHCTHLTVPVEPSILRLANVQHLATDVTGLLVDDTNVLALAASLHPTAAVCGTPTERALAMINSIEELDRGRYAGPVGWIDSRGDGEFGIALRCGEIDETDPRKIRLFAGCGIVAESDPESEVAESDAKLLAMRHALSSQL